MPIKYMTVEREYEKNPSIKKEDVGRLMEWVETQTHLPKITELEMIYFYHSCNNGVALTKSTIEIYYTLRTHLDDFFVDRDPKLEKNMFTLKNTLIVPLPQLTKEGYKVIYARLLNYEPSNFFYDVAAKTFVMITDLYQLEEGTHPGFVIIFDLDKVLLGHIARLGIMSIKHTLDYLQDAMPVRLKGFHFLNTPSFMDKILALMKPFMKKSFTELLHLHPPPIESIYKYVPKEAFPDELGGSAGSFKALNEIVIEKLLDNRQYFADEMKQRIDESKRQGKGKGTAETYGVEGSFKKLSID